MAMDRSRRLQQAREAAGFDNPTDAARAFGWNPVTYRAHESSGRGIPRQAERYAKAFGVTPEWLLYGRAHKSSCRWPAIYFVARNTFCLDAIRNEAHYLSCHHRDEAAMTDADETLANIGFALILAAAIAWWLILPA